MLVIRHHFLSYALYALDGVGIHDTELDGFRYATDGLHYYYDESSLIKDFLSESRDTSRIYLHSMLHCLYLHPYFAHQYEDHDLWDLACDMFVWDILEHLEPSDHTDIRDCLEKVKQTDRIMSAQYLYKGLYLMRRRGVISTDEIDMIRSAAKVDDHVLWYMPSGGRGSMNTAADDRHGNAESDISNSVAGNFTSVMKKWQSAADRTAMALASAMRENGKRRGTYPGDLMESLQGIRRDEISYDAFLRKFAAMEERMMIDADTFDYNYYLYGLDMYGDMPLVEPVEYKEVHTIREFVIAIDTSGSIDTETLKKFLTKTYSILCESIFADDRLDVRIIQCDAGIQDERIIHAKQDMEDYIRNLHVYGRGGTDFRPVFHRIEECRNNGELTNLSGLIYFTDGDGTYPEASVKYKTAFVFSEPYQGPDVPFWILKHYLREDLS